MEKVLNQILSELQALKGGQTRMESRMETLEHKADRIDSGLLKLESRIENEVIEKVRVLFDGYALRGDQIENLQKHLDQRLDSIEIDTGYLVSRVARREKIAK